MNAEPEQIARRIARFKETLKNAGIKVTHQRLEIFREIVETDEHPDAETMFNAVRKRMPTVSLDTVYRTLWMLQDLGLIGVLGNPRERVRFDANLDDHHHFICTNCGLTRDVYYPAFDALGTPDAVRTIGIVEKTHVELHGLCLACSQQMTK